MKKLVILLLMIFVFSSLLFFIFKSNNGVEDQILSKQNEVTKEFIKKDKTDLALSIKEIQSEVQISFETAKQCEEIISLCPECQHQWDLLVEEIKLIGSEAAGSGPYSMMPAENLQSLAEQGDPNGMFYHGANLVWKGAYGFPAFRHSSNYKMPSQKEIKNHKLDFDMVRQGEGYLFQAALKGRHQGWSELNNAKSMVFRKLLRDGTKKKKILKELLAEQLAIANVVKRIYKDDPFILKSYFVELISDVDQMLRSRRQIESSNALVKELTFEKIFIENLSKDYELQYFNQWQEARAYLGKSIYAKQFPENFGSFYKKAIELCLPDY